MSPAPRLALLGSALALALCALPVGHADAVSSPPQDTFHQDHRAAPKFQFEPAWDRPAGVDGETLARTFLTRQSADYDLPADLANLRLERVQESLLGHHTTFQQQIDGIDVDTATITVSVAKADGRVYRVYNNTYPVKSERLSAVVPPSVRKPRMTPPGTDSALTASSPARRARVSCGRWKSRASG